MAMYEGQVAQVVQSIAHDVENIRRTVQQHDISVDIMVNQRTAEVATTERMTDGSRITFDFEVRDGIAKTIKKEIANKHGQVIG